MNDVNKVLAVTMGSAHRKCAEDLQKKLDSYGGGDTWWTRMWRTDLELHLAEADYCDSILEKLNGTEPESDIHSPESNERSERGAV